MRTSWRKLQKGFLSRHGEAKERRERCLRESMGQSDELTRAYQDMEDMRDCYDSILSAAAATANSAYELSESLRDMGTCLLEKTASNEDEESGKVFLMLGKIQFELHKLVDNYRSHIFQTITVPSESLLSELRTVEEMKRQCDEKRYVYEYLMNNLRQKGRPRSSKGDMELQAAHNDFEGLASKVVFRVDSLKKGQSRSLVTQAVRHHAAQLCFFKKAFNSLETVEPHLKLITEQQHIDCRFTSREYDDSDDDDTDEDDDVGNQLKNEENANNSTENDSASKHAHDSLQLSSEYRQNKGDTVVSAPRSSMEFDCMELPFRKAATINIRSASKENLDRNYGEDASPSLRELESRSQSSPLSARKTFDPAERFRLLRPSFGYKFNSYALPTPAQTKGLASTGSDTDLHVAEQRTLTKVARTSNLSSPLELSKSDNISENQKVTGPSALSQPPALRDINDLSAWELSAQRLDQIVASETERFQRQAFSGPLTSKGYVGSTSPIVSEAMPKRFSAPLLHTHMHRALSSPKLSQSDSPTKISELHELPRPPTSIRSRLSSKVGYSGPLMSKGQGSFAAGKLSSTSASPLPTPPRKVSRSFSIPSRGQRVTVSSVSPLSEGEQTLEMDEETVTSPASKN